VVLSNIYIPAFKALVEHVTAKPANILSGLDLLATCLGNALPTRAHNGGGSSVAAAANFKLAATCVSDLSGSLAQLVTSLQNGSEMEVGKICRVLTLIGRVSRDMPFTAVAPIVEKFQASDFLTT
jgi:hypothetical protein